MHVMDTTLTFAIRMYATSISSMSQKTEKTSEWMFFFWLSLLPGVTSSAGIDKICSRVHVATYGVGRKQIAGTKTTQISPWRKNTREVLGSV